MGRSLGFFGSTVPLADHVAPHRRGRVLGRAACLALVAGLWFAARAMPGSGRLAAVIVAPPLAMPAMRPRRTPAGA